MSQKPSYEELRDALLAEQKKNQELLKLLSQGGKLPSSGNPADQQTIERLTRELAEAKRDLEASENARKSADEEASRRNAELQRQLDAAVNARDRAERQAEDYRRELDEMTRDAVGRTRYYKAVATAAVSASLTTLILAIVIAEPLRKRFH